MHYISIAGVTAPLGDGSVPIWAHTIIKVPTTTWASSYVSTKGYYTFPGQCLSDPVPMHLPPLDSVWYPCDGTGYGPIVRDVSLEYLYDQNGPGDHPCGHTYATGDITMQRETSDLRSDWNATLSRRLRYGTFPSTAPYASMLAQAAPYIVYSRTGVASVRNLNWGTTRYRAPVGFFAKSREQNPLLDYYGNNQISDLYQPLASSRVITETSHTGNGLRGTFRTQTQWNCAPAYSRKAAIAQVLVNDVSEYYVRSYSDIKLFYQIVQIRGNSTGSYSIRYESTVIGSMSALDTTADYAVVTTSCQSTATYEMGINPFRPAAMCDLIAPDMKVRLRDILFHRMNNLRDPKVEKSVYNSALADVPELDANNIENLAQIKGTLSVFEPLLQGVKAAKLGDLKLALRALSGAFLAYTYVVKPMISDSSDIITNTGGYARLLHMACKGLIQKRRFTTQTDGVYGSSPHLRYSTSFKLSLKDANLLWKLWIALETLGLEPSLKNGWDLVPFSFVLDWFTGIGDMLGNVQNWFEAIFAYELVNSCSSLKLEMSIRDADGILDELFRDSLTTTTGTLEVSAYSRWVSGRWNEEFYDPLASLGAHFGGSQWLQSGALVTSFKTR